MSAAEARVQRAAEARVQRAAEARVQRAELGTDTVPMDVVDLPATRWVDVSWSLTLAEPTG